LVVAGCGTDINLERQEYADSAQMVRGVSRVDPTHGPFLDWRGCWGAAAYDLITCIDGCDLDVACEFQCVADYEAQMETCDDWYGVVE